ncbi:hypothetical protein K7432_010644 [Basidiobolus ranarum]|uniref:SCP2 domain-containing protein n=1 Tax=Basidiobolus ranarum TaxID=34480 RepID=A0ABR2VV61_9FUNG
MLVSVPGLKRSPIFEKLKATIEDQNDVQKQVTIEKTKGIFQFDIKNNEGKVQTWSMDLKKQGTVNTGKPGGTPDVLLTLSDDVFADLASGKLDSTKAYMQGKLKFKGSMMLATKLDSVLNDAKKVNYMPRSSTPNGKPESELVVVDGFQASAVFDRIKSGMSSFSQQRKDNIQKVQGIFQIDIENVEGKVQSWTLKMKDGNSELILGPMKPPQKPDVVISASDKDFVDLSSGRLNGQKAFMEGKLTFKGSMILATKLDTVLKGFQKAKL